MPKLKVTQRKLTELDVKYVSLVDRAATRIPFRIIKRNPQQESAMLDLARIGLAKILKGDAAPEQAVLAAVILSKSDPVLAEAVQKAMSAQGVELPKVQTFDDGTMSLSVEEDFSEGSTIIRLSENLAMVVKGFNPYGSSLDELSFGEAATARGFYDGVRGALSTFNDMVMARMYKADSPDAAATEVQSAMDDLKKYMVTLTKALPAAVFKIEEPVETLVLDFIAKADKAKEPDEDDAAPDGADAGKWKAMSKEDRKKYMGLSVEEKAAYFKKADPVVIAPEVVVAPVTEKVEDKNPQFEQLMTAVTALTSSITEIKKSMTEQGTALADLKKSTEEKLVEVTRKAEDAAKAVNSTVISSTTSGDPVPLPRVVKKDDDPRSGIFDTAYIAKRAVSR